MNNLNNYDDAQINTALEMVELINQTVAHKKRIGEIENVLLKQDNSHNPMAMLMLEMRGLDNSNPLDNYMEEEAYFLSF